MPTTRGQLDGPGHTEAGGGQGSSLPGRSDNVPSRVGLILRGHCKSCGSPGTPQGPSPKGKLRLGQRKQALRLSPRVPAPTFSRPWDVFQGWFYSGRSRWQGGRGVPGGSRGSGERRRPPGLGGTRSWLCAQPRICAAEPPQTHLCPLWASTSPRQVASEGCLVSQIPPAVRRQGTPRDGHKGLMAAPEPHVVTDSPRSCCTTPREPGCS